MAQRNRGIGYNPTLDNIYQTNNQNNLYDMAQDSDRYTTGQNYAGYNNYSGTQAWPEYNPNMFKGVGRFDPNNLMRPDNLTQDMGASMYQAGPAENVNRPLLDTYQRSPHEGFNEFTAQAPEKKQSIFERLKGGLTSIKKGGKKLMTPLMMMAQSVNPLDPNSSNFNPMLEGQIEEYTSQGWRVNEQGQAIDGPLAGKNLVSMRGTNDVTQMLRNRLQKIRTRKFNPNSAASIAKQKEIRAAIDAQTAAENAGYQGTPGGNVGSGVFAKMDQSGKTYGPYSGGSGNNPGMPQGNAKGSMPSGTAGRNPWGRADGGRIGYQGGELVDEDINIQGPGFDVNENMEMAEGEDFLLREEYNKYLFEMDELDLEPMSFADFKAQAMVSEGQEDSFSEEGIASLV